MKAHLKLNFVILMAMFAALLNNYYAFQNSVTLMKIYCKAF